LRYAIDAADESFDLLLSLEVLEHIKDQTEKVFGDIVLFNGSGAQKFVDEIWRVVRPGGLVILTTPNPTCLLALIKLIGYEPPMVYRPHVREYTKGEICKLFDKFKLVKYCSFFAYGYIGIGEQKAREYVERLGWDPADRGDCHFFVFQRPDAV
jgi:SAM-dependent methyltransferase